MQDHARIRFLGALGQVTGSSTLLHYRERYYLIDCGIQQGPGAAEGGLPIPPSGIAAVFLTHAHMDHCGLLPWMARNGFKGKVWCSRATAELTRLALRDAAAHKGSGFSSWDVENISFCAFDDKEGFQFSDVIALQDGLTFSVFRTSHILGSVGFEFIYDEGTKGKRKTLVFSGDVGVNSDACLTHPLLNARQDPSTHAAYIVCESTYGNRNREEQYADPAKRLEALHEALCAAAERGDNPVVVIPCFTLQRMQDLMTDLTSWSMQIWKSAVPFGKLDVVCDSSLAIEYSRIFVSQLARKRPNGKALWLGRHFEEKYVRENVQLSRALELLVGSDSIDWDLENSPRSHVTLRVILAGSGMCHGGRVVKHLKEHLTNVEATVLLTGYQSPGTPGGNLIEMARDASIRKDFPEWDIRAEDVRATIVDLSPYFSGHADQKGLLNFLLNKTSQRHKYEKVRRVFLNHGEDGARIKLKEAILERQGKEGRREVEAVELPYPNSGWFDLVENRWVDAFDPAIDDQTFQIVNLQRRLELIEAVLDKAGMRNILEDLREALNKQNLAISREEVTAELPIDYLETDSSRSIEA